MGRVLLSALISFVVVIGLFLLMNSLINAVSDQEDKEIIKIEVAYVDEEKKVQRKERRVPKKPPPPKEPPPPQQQQEQQKQKVVTAIVNIQIDNLDTSLDGQGIYIGGLGAQQGDFSGFGDGDAIPTYSPKPNYPQQANLKGITGFVRFKFDIGADGSPSNISIIEEKPRGVFRKEGKKAIRKWKFKPRIVNGQPVIQRGMSYKLVFELDE